MKKVILKKDTTKRAILEKLDLSLNSYDLVNQSEMINKLYLNEKYFFSLFISSYNISSIFD